jgi:hypothetical protein
MPGGPLESDPICLATNAAHGAAASLFFREFRAKRNHVFRVPSRSLSANPKHREKKTVDSRTRLLQFSMRSVMKSKDASAGFFNKPRSIKAAHFTHSSLNIGVMSCIVMEVNVRRFRALRAALP